MENENKPAEKSAFDSLNARQQAFVLHYLDCLNASEASRRAGYQTERHDQQGYENLRKPEIRDAISEMGEIVSMPQGEAVRRMDRWARGSMEPFMDEAGNLILDTPEAIEARHTIKKYKSKTIRRYSQEDPNKVTEETTVEIELYDAKDATDKMLQLHGRYKQLPGGGGSENNDKVIYRMPDGSVIEF